MSTLQTQARAILQEWPNLEAAHAALMLATAASIDYQTAAAIIAAIIGA